MSAVKRRKTQPSLVLSRRPFLPAKVTGQEPVVAGGREDRAHNAAALITLEDSDGRLGVGGESNRPPPGHGLARRAMPASHPSSLQRIPPHPASLEPIGVARAGAEHHLRPLVVAPPFFPLALQPLAAIENLRVDYGLIVRNLEHNLGRTDGELWDLDPLRA